MKQSDHAQRHCVYLFSRKLLFTQQAEENVLWISLERFNILSQRKQCYKHWILKLHYFSLLDSHNSIVNNSKQQTNCIQKKNDTACYLLLCLFPWLWLTFRGPFVNHAIKTILCHIVATGNVWLLINFLWRNNLSPCSHYYTSNHHCLYCMYLYWYLIRRACCKWTVSSCEDVSHVWIISRVWNRIKRQSPS